MKDNIFLRCVSIIGGILMFIVAATTGADGDLKAAGAALIAFGIGAGIGSAITARAAIKATIRAERKQQ